jgi:hypothetical protein
MYVKPVSEPFLFCAIDSRKEEAKDIYLLFIIIIIPERYLLSDCHS